MIKMKNILREAGLLKELPSQSFKLHNWVLSNKLHQKPGANLFE